MVYFVAASNNKYFKIVVKNMCFENENCATINETLLIYN